jgi:pilus assembly protein CpaE
MNGETEGNMRVVIATDAPEVRDVFRQAVLSIGLDCAADDCVFLAAATTRLAQAPVDLILVVLGDGGAGLDVVKLAAARTNLPVLAAGPVDDPQRIIRALRAGAREYLDQNNAREELALALEKIRPAGVAERRQGRLIAVTSACPGSGVTTAAAGLAFALARQDAGQVVLAEVGNGVPELALDLDLEPRHSPADLTRDWQRMDITMLHHALVDHPSGVQILAYPPGTLVPAALEAAAFGELLLLLRKACDVAVLDLGHAVRDAFLDAVLLADLVVVITRLDVPGLRLSRQYLHDLLESGVVESKIHVVANRYGQRRQLAWRSAQEALGSALRPSWLTDDPASLNEALNHGQPLLQVAPRATLTKQLAKLAHELAEKMKDEISSDERLMIRAGRK